MKKLNCWEIKKCGREVGGDKADDLGICPAATDISSDGINSGKNGGRICWVVAGTFCKGKIQGAFALETFSCVICDVFSKVKREECPETFTLLKASQPYSASHK